MAHSQGLLSNNYGLLWGIVVHDFGLLGLPGHKAGLLPITEAQTLSREPRACPGKLALGSRKMLCYDQERGLAPTVEASRMTTSKASSPEIVWATLAHLWATFGYSSLSF